jgi:membrane protease subunit (stomatin/prohibitin family)
MAIWDRITSQFIEIIEWLDDSHDTLAWRFPVRGQEIKNGARLVVREGQMACFVNEGKLADVFGPGTYTLTTQNLPVLATLAGWKYGFNSPFKAEVYFVATTQFTDQKWGTQNPIMVRDPEFGPLRLRAFGAFSFRVTDAARFLRNLAGTDGRFEVDEILGQLKRTLVSRFTQALAAAKIPALDLAGNYHELAEKVRPIIRADLEDLGIEVTKLVIENVSLPPEVERILDKRSEMAIMGNVQQYAAYQMASAIPDAARTPNGLAGAGMGLAAGIGMGQQMMGMMGGMMPQGGAPAAPAARPEVSMVDRLKKLDGLKAAGVLTDEEYQKKRAEILSEL